MNMFIEWISANLFLTGLLIGGAVAKVGTLLHTFARAFDTFIQDNFWNDNLGITLSSRAGLAARNGNTKYATLINTLFLNKTHCEQAIADDILLAQKTIAVLSGN